jgi:hypothetical protein
MNRDEVLKAAAKAVGVDRQESYGLADENLSRIARLWSAVFAREFTSSDVALAVALVAVSRLAHEPGHEDSWVDLAGSASLGAEVAT